MTKGPIEIYFEKNNAGSRAIKKRRIMHELIIKEISAVDVPAQEGATAVIMKRKHGPGLEDEKKKKKSTSRKSQTEEFNLEKGASLTNEEDGHAHLINNLNFDGDERSSGTTSWEQDSNDRGHSHPWILGPSGEIIVGAANSHTHEIAVTTKREFSTEQREKLVEEGKALPDGSFPIVTKADLKNALKAFGRAKNKAKVARHIKKRARALGAMELLPKEGVLADLLKKTAGEYERANDERNTDVATKPKEGDAPTVESLQAELATAKSVAALSDVAKAHYNNLEDDAAGVFLAKSVEVQNIELAGIAKAALDSDPVVYKTMDGLELRKSDGASLLAMAKSNDVIRKENAELKKTQDQASLEKRTEELLPHLPGDLATRAVMLKSIEGIEDETQREAALCSLKAQNESLSKAVETYGHAGGTPAAGSPDAELETLVKAYVKANPDVSEPQAYDAVLKTAAGEALYAKSLN